MVSYDRGIPKCKRCIYSELLSESVTFCNYIGKTGHRRGCPPGWDCAKFSPRKGRGYKKQPWHDQAMELYNQGCLDSTIAATVGASASVVCHWRQINGLRTNVKLRPCVRDITGDVETRCLEMYFDGASDADIAAKCGIKVTENIIKTWRLTNKLYLRPERRRLAKAAMVQAGKWPRKEGGSQ